MSCLRRLFPITAAGGAETSQSENIISVYPHRLRRYDIIVIFFGCPLGGREKGLKSKYNIRSADIIPYFDTDSKTARTAAAKIYAQ